MAYAYNAVGAPMAQAQMGMQQQVAPAQNIPEGDRPVCDRPKVFVGQLNPTVTEADLAALFSKYGALRSCEIPGANMGTPRGFAMVVFESWAAAETAIEYENGNCTLNPEGKALVVRFADPPQGGAGGPAIAPKKLFVGQLAPGTNEDAIRQMFARFGTIVDIYILQTGCAFVKFDRWAEAEAAAEALNAVTTMEGAKAPLVVKFADAKGTVRTGGGGGYGAGPQPKLFVGQLAPTVTDDVLREMFGPFGSITDTYVMNKGQSTCCAFVKYERWAEAEAAAEALNGSTTMDGAKAPLVVRFADVKARDGGLKRSADQAQGYGMAGMGAKRHQTGGTMMMGGMGGMAGMYNPMMGGMGGMMANPMMGGMGADTSLGGMGMQAGGMGMGGMGMTGQDGMGMGMQGGMMQGGMAGGMVQGMDGSMQQTQQGGMMQGGMAGGMAGGMVQGGMQQAQPVQRNTGPPVLPEGAGPKLFIGQLPYQSVEADVIELLSAIGPVLHVHVLTKPNGQSRGCAFAVFADRASADAAIARLNGVVGLLAGGEGRALVVKYADSQ